MEELQLVWGWQPALYLFLGGMGAGAFIVAAVLFLVNKAKNRRTASVSMFVAALCLILGLLLLLFELINPLRGLLLWQSFSNISSWMTIGAWIVLVAVIVFLVTAILASPILQKRYVKGRMTRLRRIDVATSIFGIMGVVLGLGVAVYTGVLLMWAPGVPLWKTFLLPCLFTVSALGTGVALVEIVALSLNVLSLTKKSPLTVKSLLLLEKSAVALVLLETVIFVAFAMVMLNGNTAEAGESSSFSIVAVTSVKLLTVGYLAPFFWVLFIGCGLATPLIAAIIGLTRHKQTSTLSITLGATATLIGGCALRFLILFAGEHADFVSDTVMNLAF
jgi:formate-dependent nitrite reductase membrane component NrfD